MLSPSPATAGRFLSGCSGNPRGRPLGRRNKLTILKEALRQQDVDRAIQIIGDHLAKRRPAMARFVVRQLDGKRRASRVEIAVPAGRYAGRALPGAVLRRGARRDRAGGTPPALQGAGERVQAPREERRGG